MPQEIVSQFDRKYGLPIETYRSVQNLTQRNNIPDSIRWEGMIVHVLGDQSYILLGGTDDTKWEPLGGLVDVNVVDDLLSTSPTDALSANQGRVLKDLIDNIDLSDYQLLSEKGSANGYAPLDSGAKVPIANLPDSVVGQVEYQGTWAASTNTPTLSNPPDSSTKGHYYVCSDSGTQFSISFQTGDWIISNGSAWEKVDNTDAVTSVFGRIGAVIANAGDYTFAQIGSKPTTILGYGITDAYTESEVDTLLLGKLGVSDKAADSELLDGINSTQFLRSDQDDNTSGVLRMAVNSGINGSGFGDSNTAFMSFYESNGSMRQGWVGFGSSGDSNFRVVNETAANFIQLNGAGGENSLIFNHGSGSRIVWHEGNFAPASYLRSDVADEKTAGALTFNDGIALRFGTSGGESSMYSNGNHTFLDMANGSFFIRDGTTQRYVFNDNGNMVATGSITAASFETADWQIIQSGTTLQFKYQGATLFEMQSDGTIEASNTFKQGIS